MKSKLVPSDVWKPMKVAPFFPNVSILYITTHSIKDWRGRFFILNEARPVTRWRLLRTWLGFPEKDSWRASR